MAALAAVMAKLSAAGFSEPWIKLAGAGGPDRAATAPDRTRLAACLARRIRRRPALQAGAIRRGARQLLHQGRNYERVGHPGMLSCHLPAGDFRMVALAT